MTSSLFSRLFDPIRSLFDFNQAHLSGCMDVIVVRLPNGELSCTPFHVRFGTFKVLKVHNVLVKIEINGQPLTGLQMSLAEDGHGFFIKESEDPTTKKTILKPSLRLNSDKLKCLGLKEGENKVIYSVESEFQGRQTLQCRVFFWDQKDLKIAVSDIDGTVTKSDVMGHVMTMIKKDWTHAGIAKLYCRLQKQGYKMVYITARPASQYLYTLKYMERVNQDGLGLPSGPILMSPDFLLDSAKREVLFKTPEKLKIPILRDINKLAKYGENPFVAGFGNRESDAVAYLSNGLKKSQIFIINKKSQIQKLDSPEILSYTVLEEQFSKFFEGN